MRYKEFIVVEDAARLRQLQQELGELDPNVSNKFLDTIERSIAIARESGQSAGEDLTGKLQKVDDRDLKKWYRYIAKEMVGHELSINEIKTLLNAINDDTVINLEEFAKISSTIDKIIPLYSASPAFKNFFSDLFYTVPQRVGPAEILFITMSKSITKGGKGDLQITAPINKEVEVKAGKTSGRFRDGDITKLQNPNLRKYQRDFLKKYPSGNKAGHNLGSLMQLLADTSYDKKEVVNDVMVIFNSLFPMSSFAVEFENAFTGGNLEKAKELYAVANLETYYKAKGAKAFGFLFIKSAKEPYTTCYIDSYDDIIKGLRAGTLTIDPGLAYPMDQSGNNEEYPKIGFQG